jgi:hypothetical protein
MPAPVNTTAAAADVGAYGGPAVAYPGDEQDGTGWDVYPVGGASGGPQGEACPAGDGAAGDDPYTTVGLDGDGHDAVPGPTDPADGDGWDVYAQPAGVQVFPLSGAAAAGPQANPVPIVGSTGPGATAPSAGAPSGPLSTQPLPSYPQSVDQVFQQPNPI